MAPHLITAFAGKLIHITDEDNNPTNLYRTRCGRWIGNFLTREPAYIAQVNEDYCEKPCQRCGTIDDFLAINAQRRAEFIARSDAESAARRASQERFTKRQQMRPQVFETLCSTIGATIVQNDDLRSEGRVSITIDGETFVATLTLYSRNPR